MKPSRCKSSGRVVPCLLAAAFAISLIVGCVTTRIEYRCPFGELNSEAWAEIAMGHLDGAPEVENFLMEIGRQCGWDGFSDG